MDHSPFLNRDENRWMKSVLEIVRKTSIYFQPQIRTKIMNEGWASYWHEKLFLEDERIRGHEVEFARVHAGVASLPRVGVNPYALGMRLFTHVEEMAEKGRLTAKFQRLQNADQRRSYDAGAGEGLATIFAVREDLSDFLFISTFVDQDFVDRHRLFVAERRLNQSRMVWEYFVKSRKAEDYKQMLRDTLYHPPSIEVEEKQTNDGVLQLVHLFEGKPLVRDYLANTMLGIEYLWGAPVSLETSEVVKGAPTDSSRQPEIAWQRVRYEMKNRLLSKTPLS
jgi:stage V sporulation protein R